MLLPIKTTVLVTGATGFIGQAVVTALLEAGYTVRGLMRPTSTWPFAEAARLTPVIGNMQDLDSLIRATKGVDFICHLAAAKSDEPDSEQTNITGAENLVAAAAQNRVTNIINISTQSTKLAKKGTYARTKAAADQIFSNSPINTVTLYPSLVYGGKQSGVAASLVRFSRLPFIPVFGSGQAVFYPIAVDDLAQLIVKCYQAKPKPGAKYDAGGPEAVSFNQMIKLILQAQNKTRPIIHLPIWLGLLVAKLLSWLPRPPFTASNVRGSSEVTAMDSQPLYELCHFTPRSFSKAVNTEVQSILAPDQTDAVALEATALMQYAFSLSGFKWAPGPTEIDRYKRALVSHQVDPQHRLPALLLRHSWLLGGLDAITKFAKPNGPLRQKLIIAGALVEYHPVSANWLVIKKMTKTKVIFSLINSAGRSFLKVIIGLVLICIPGFIRRYG